MAATYVLMPADPCGHGAAGEKVLQMATEGEKYVLQDKTRGGFQNFCDSKATRKYRSCQL